MPNIINPNLRNSFFFYFECFAFGPGSWPLALSFGFAILLDMTANFLQTNLVLTKIQNCENGLAECASHVECLAWRNSRERLNNRLFNKK